MKKTHTSKTILVVEDEAPLREAIKFKLKKAGITVLEAGSGEEALKILSDHIPDLVWLDILLPGINGIEVLKNIKADPRIKDVKVVVVSVSSGDEKMKGILQLKADEYIVKSNFPLETIVDKVIAHVNSSPLPHD